MKLESPWYTVRFVTACCIALAWLSDWIVISFHFIIQSESSYNHGSFHGPIVKESESSVIGWGEPITDDCLSGYGTD